MIIGRYIKQLLEERKRVILPGFGNLEIKETDGGVPPSGSRIDPPGLSVRFNTGFSKDDGLLASLFATGEQLDAEEAGQRVLELVDSIKFALDKGESFTIPETGTFHRDDDGKVHFQLDPVWILEPDQYGLESMDLMELEELPVEEEKEPVPAESVKQSPARPADEKAAPTPPVKPSVKTAAKVTELHPPVKTKRRINKWRVIWIIAGALIVILVALIFIPEELIKSQKSKVENEEVENLQPETESPQPETESREVESKKLENENQQPIVEEPHNFFIIAGSFQHLKYASDLQDRLKGRGYPAEVLITENRLYRVSVVSYATKEEALKGLAGIKAVSGLESCWLLSN